MSAHDPTNRPSSSPLPEAGASRTPGAAPPGQEGDGGIGAALLTHRGAALDYAAVCGRNRRAAEALTDAAFDRTVRAVRSGGERRPLSAWYPRLLAGVRETAAGWFFAGHAEDLAPGFTAWLCGDPPVGERPGRPDGPPRERRETHGPYEIRARSCVRRAFCSLSEQAQAAVWHGCVELRRPDELAALLEAEEEHCAALLGSARERLRENFLLGCEALVPGDDEVCRRFARLLGASDRGPDRRPDEDLEAHRRECGHCTEALRVLDELCSRPGETVAEAVLLWGGEAYARSRAAGRGPGPVTVTVTEAAKASKASGPPSAAPATAGAPGGPVAGEPSPGRSHPDTDPPTVPTPVVEVPAAPEEGLPLRLRGRRTHRRRTGVAVAAAAAILVTGAALVAGAMSSPGTPQHTEPSVPAQEGTAPGDASASPEVSVSAPTRKPSAAASGSASATAPSPTRTSPSAAPGAAGTVTVSASIVGPSPTGGGTTIGNGNGKGHGPGGGRPR